VVADRPVAGAEVAGVVAASVARELRPSSNRVGQ
jgi:hypothetical protein